MGHVFPNTRLVGMCSFALNYFFNQLNPRGYHLFNFLVHLAAAGLVWAISDLLFRITKAAKDPFSRELSFFIALLFLVHPCQTQAVSYISQRFESMACVFYLGSLYCYLCARLSRGAPSKISLYGLCGLLVLLGVFTKEVILTVPLMMLVLGWILFPKKENRKFYFVLVPGGALLYLLSSKLLHADVSVFFQTTLSQSHDGEILTPVHYFLTQGRVVLTFLRLLVLPVHQNLDYDYPASTGVLQPPLTLAGFLVIGGMICLIVKLRRSMPLTAFGLAWFLITFSINFVPRANVIFEHKLYLISYGFFIAVVSALSVLVRQRALLRGILWLMVAVLAVISFQRNKVWSNELVLWKDTVQQSPHKARGYNALGYAYFNQGNLTQALLDFNKAIALNPGYADAYNNRGLVYDHLNQFGDALSDYNKAIALNPNYPEAINNRGVFYAQHGNLTKALNDFTRVIELIPHYSAAYHNRGLVYDQLKEFDRANEDRRKAQLDEKILNLR